MKFIANGSISQSVSLSKQKKKKLDETLARLLERYPGNFLALCFLIFALFLTFNIFRPLHRRIVIFFCNLSCSRFFIFVSISELFSGLQWQTFINRSFAEHFSFFDIYSQFLNRRKVGRYSNFLSEFGSLNFVFWITVTLWSYLWPSKQLVFKLWKL